jgi:putative SOS response-associated peptidase YedK
MISTILEQARAEEAAANVPQAIDLLDRLGPNVLISGTRVAKQSRRLGGLVNSWTKDASRASMCINAKAETADKLPSFREAFEERRCVVPADEFYEGRGPKAMREPLDTCRRNSPASQPIKTRCRLSVYYQCTL